MIVPVLTSLDTVTAADALGRIEENASCLAVAEPRDGNQAAVLLNALGKACRTIGHAPMYHFFFAAVNYRWACGKRKQRLNKIAMEEIGRKIVGN